MSLAGFAELTCRMLNHVIVLSKLSAKHELETSKIAAAGTAAFTHHLHCTSTSSSNSSPSVPAQFAGSRQRLCVG